MTLFSPAVKSTTDVPPAVVTLVVVSPGVSAPAVVSLVVVSPGVSAPTVVTTSRRVAVTWHPSTNESVVRWSSTSNKVLVALVPRASTLVMEMVVGRELKIGVGQMVLIVNSGESWKSSGAIVTLTLVVLLKNLLFLMVIIWPERTMFSFRSVNDIVYGHTEGSD